MVNIRDETNEQDKEEYFLSFFFKYIDYVEKVNVVMLNLKNKYVFFE